MLASVRTAKLEKQEGRNQAGENLERMEIGEPLSGVGPLMSNHNGVL